MPEYITCEVERAEVVSPGEASEFELGLSGNQRVHSDPVNKTTTESK